MIAARNMRRGQAWDAMFCPVGGSTGYQPKQSGFDRIEHKV